MIYKLINKSWKRQFILIWLGQAFSQLSSSILQMAVVWYLIANTNSPTLIALSGIMAFLPQGLLGLFIGVIIDRYNKKTIMILSDLLIALASLTLVLFATDGHVSTSLILIILFIRSVGTAFHTPSLQAITPQLVPIDMLTKCSGYSQTLQSISLILSPAIAALLFSIWDLNYIVLLDVIGALIAFITLSFVKISNVKIETHLKTHLFKELTEGILILKEKKLLLFAFINSVFSFIYMPLFILYPMMTLSYFQKTSAHAGFVEILFAIGMLGGSVILGRIPFKQNKLPFIGLSGILMGLSMFLSGILSQNAFLIFALLSTILGFASPFYQGLQTIIYQEQIEEQYLGRVMSLTGSLLVIATPIGIYLSGVISEIIGVHHYFAFSGFFMMMASILYFIKREHIQK